MRKAFTLIELLVVIAIIAILAAILFPVFAQAKEAAKKTACLSGTKQTGVAFYMYATDSDDILPQTSWEGTITPNPINPGDIYQIHWTYNLQPYMKNMDILVCNSDQDPQVPKNKCPNPSDIGKLNSSGQMYCDWMAPKYSYIPNYNLIPAHDWLPVSMTQFETPANLILITERRNKLKNAAGTILGRHKGTSGFNPSQPCPQWTIVPYSGNGSPGAGTYAMWTKTQADFHLVNDTNDKNDITRVAWDRHTGGANYAYADGHSKFQKLDATLNPTAYQYGEKWYPSPMAGGQVCP